MSRRTKQNLKKLIYAGIVTLILAGCAKMVNGSDSNSIPRCGDPNHPYPVGDLNQDCCVDLLDLAILASHWLEDNKPVNSNSIIKDGIEYYIQTDKFVYELGEEVEMSYKVINLRNEDVTFGFGSTIQNDFIVQAKLGDNLKEIWRRTYFSGGTGIPSHFSLSPNGSKEFRDIWPQIDARGTVTPVDDIPATPGTYKILGCLTYGYESSSKVGVDIRIVP